MTPIQVFYVIKHKPTDTYFPLWTGGQRRGSTYLTLPFTGPPRLFPSRNAASTCLRWWLGGPAVPEYERDDFNGEEYRTGASIGKGHPDRHPEDLEVVPVTLSAINEETHDPSDR